MTDFGDNMKAMLSGMKANGVGTKDVIVKKEKKVTTYAYESEVSGIDFVITKKVSGKETMKLVCYLSQKNEDGSPICFIQEKGKYIAVDENILKTFLNGLSHSEFFTDGTYDVVDRKTGAVCESVPKLYKTNGDNRFIRCFMFMIEHPEFIEHMKMGIINLEMVYQWVDSEEGTGWGRESEYNLPWFFKSDYGSYSRCSLDFLKGVYAPGMERRFNEDVGEFELVSTEGCAGINSDNIHLKLFRKSVEINMKNGTMTQQRAKNNIFFRRGGEGNDYGAKCINMDLFRAFLILANRYDEPFAIRCMEDYVSNSKLSGMSYDRLNCLFTIDVERYVDGRGTFNDYSRRGYGYNSSYTTLSLNLTKHAPNDQMREKLLNLEKNRFWDFILQATCVGLGKNLNNYLQLWADYITSCLLYFKKVSDKYPEHLQEAHDIMCDKYSTYSQFKEEDKLKLATVDAVRYCELKDDKYVLHVFTSVKEYLDEATAQGNCLASCDYAGKTANGQCWIASLRMKNDDTPIDTVEINPRTGKMVQIKARYNHEPALEHVKVLKKFQDKIYKNMIDYGVINEPAGYLYTFDVLKNQKREEE